VEAAGFAHPARWPIFAMTRQPRARSTRRTAVLFSLAALCIAGCLAGSTDDGPAAPDDPPDDDLLPEPVPEAFFVFHGADLDSPGWPGDYARYSLFVCTPTLPAAEVAEIRAARPDARLLAYTNTQDIPLGRNPGSPYYDALTAAFDSSLCVIDLTTGDVLRLQGYTGVPGSGVPHWVPRTESIEVLVAFHRDVTMAAGFDGLYVDQCNAAYPPWRQALLDSLTSAFDADGDGLADRVEDVVSMYAAGRPVLTRRLREVLGEDALLIANSGGALADPELQGITLEGVGDRFTVQQARSFLAQQEAVGRPPFTAVLWATTAASEGPSRTVAGEFPGVHYGVIDSAD